MDIVQSIYDGRGRAGVETLFRGAWHIIPTGQGGGGMLIVEDQSRISLEMCEALASEGLMAVIKSGRVIYFIPENSKEEQNNGKCQ